MNLAERIDEPIARTSSLIENFLGINNGRFLYAEVSHSAIGDSMDLTRMNPEITRQLQESEARIASLEVSNRILEGAVRVLQHEVDSLREEIENND